MLDKHSAHVSSMTSTSSSSEGKPSHLQLSWTNLSLTPSWMRSKFTILTETCGRHSATYQTKRDSESNTLRLSRQLARKSWSSVVSSLLRERVQRPLLMTMGRESPWLTSACISMWLLEPSPEDLTWSRHPSTRAEQTCSLIRRKFTPLVLELLTRHQHSKLL